MESPAGFASVLAAGPAPTYTFASKKRGDGPQGVPTSAFKRDMRTKRSLTAEFDAVAAETTGGGEGSRGSLGSEGSRGPMAAAMLSPPVRLETPPPDSEPPHEELPPLVETFQMEKKELVNQLNVLLRDQGELMDENQRLRTEVSDLTTLVEQKQMIERQAEAVRTRADQKRYGEFREVVDAKVRAEAQLEAFRSDIEVMINEKVLLQQQMNVLLKAEQELADLKETSSAEISALKESAESLRSDKVALLDQFNRLLSENDALESDKLLLQRLVGNQTTAADIVGAVMDGVGTRASAIAEHRSLYQKASLLKCAVLEGDGEALLFVVVFLRATLSNTRFYELLSDYEPAQAAFAAHLRRQQRFRELHDFYQRFHRIKDAGMALLEEAMTNSDDAQSRMYAVQSCLPFFSLHPSLSFEYEMLVKMLASLESELQASEPSYESFVDLALSTSPDELIEEDWPSLTPARRVARAMRG